MKVTCVIPTYNDIKTLPGVINDLVGKVDEIIVVDDGSEVDIFGAIKHLPIYYLRHVVNCGQGAALKTGTKQALINQADIIVHFDADGQFRAQDITRLIEPIKNKTADIVFGSRFLDDTTIMPTFKKHVIMPLARFINRVLFNIRLTDPQSGFRILSRRAALAINWEQDRMAHCSEILFKAHESGLPITELPITVLYNGFGQRFSGGFKILKDLFFHKLNN